MPYFCLFSTTIKFLTRTVLQKVGLSGLVSSANLNFLLTLLWLGKMPSLQYLQAISGCQPELSHGIVGCKPKLFCKNTNNSIQMYGLTFLYIRRFCQSSHSTWQPIFLKSKTTWTYIFCSPGQEISLSYNKVRHICINFLETLPWSKTQH